LPSGVHVTRHSFATRAINRGVSLHSVKAMLGHSQLSSTALYLWVAVDGLVAEYRRCLEAASQGGEAR
jgi:integrase/recombinase XerC/integrase/recombinase XerD